ncbi:hypothetical protein Tco_0454975 [Tanacetum coccineum]
MKRVNTFTPMKSDDTVPKVVAGSLKIDVEQELNQESSKRQKIGEGSEPAEESKDELSQKQLQHYDTIVPEEGMNVEALQTKYPIIDWEVYTEDSRKYWKIIRVGNHTEGDILYLEKLLNEDSYPTLPPLKNDDLKQVDVSMMKPSIKEPPELELKDLPSHLEYAFLEGTDKLPVIISKELKNEEKAALLKVLKSHKRAIAWKISDIKGINPSFCTHKILMEDDFKPAVQHQRRVNPKICEVIKKEVIKLLDAGLIYPISDSPWVSLVHCVPKKGGMTIVENEDNELIPTWLFTGWHVCIDYRKLNDATRKDHFPLPFMDQMLERLTGNEYYCF